MNLIAFGLFSALSTFAYEQADCNFAVGSLREPILELTGRADLIVGLYHNHRGKPIRRAQLLDNGAYVPEREYIWARSKGRYEFANTEFFLEPLEDDDDVLDVCGNWPLDAETFVRDASGRRRGFFVRLARNLNEMYRTSNHYDDELNRVTTYTLQLYWAQRLDQYLENHLVFGLSGFVIAKRSRGCHVEFSKQSFAENPPDILNFATWGVPEELENNSTFSPLEEFPIPLFFTIDGRRHDIDNADNMHQRHENVLEEHQSNIGRGMFVFAGGFFDDEREVGNMYFVHPPLSLCSLKIEERLLVFRKSVSSRFSEFIASGFPV